VVILDAARVCVKALRAGELLPSTEAPAEPSHIWAPAGLFPTAEEREASGRFRREEPAQVAT
jgi:carbon starvation protein